MTQTDKEKLEQAIALVYDLIKSYENSLKMFVKSDQPDKVELILQTINDLQKILRTLEED